MSVLGKLFVACCVCICVAGEVCASEVILKVASVEADALEAFRVPQSQFFLGSSAIDYSALAAALTHSVSSPEESVKNAPIKSVQLVPAVLRDAPPALQVLYPEQGRLIGRQMPGGSSGWHKYLIDFSEGARSIFIEFGVEYAVLDSLASGSSVAALNDRPVKQYAQGSSLEPGAVFTAGYSFFVQQIARGNAHGWLERVMPLQNGIGILALRRGGSETRTDTVILRIDPRYFAQTVFGRNEVLVVLGWDR
jgi:hypothetical protein